MLGGQETRAVAFEGRTTVLQHSCSAMPELSVRH